MTILPRLDTRATVTLDFKSRRAAGMALGLIAAVVTTAAAAASQAANPSYVAPSTCPDRRHFVAEVEAKLGFSPWGRATSSLTVRIVAAEKSFQGHLRSGEAAKSFAASSCREVFSLLVSATAVALDSRAQSGRAPGSSPRVTSAPDGGRTPRTLALYGDEGNHRDRDGLIIPDAGKVASDWSFAPRNNRYQLGLMFTEAAGFGLTGNVPLARRNKRSLHLQATAAQRTYDGQYGEGKTQYLHAYLMTPVFFLNERSSFEVPLMAGAGLMWKRYSFDQTLGEDVADTYLTPAVVIGTAIQFRKLPLELGTQLALALTKDELTNSRTLFNFAFRYVFRR